MYVTAGDFKRRMVLADGLLVRPFEQAINLALGIVVELDLANPELIGPAS